MNVAVVGTGYVGLVTGAALAEFGHQVTCIDSDRPLVARLQAGQVHIAEPGLEELVRRNRIEQRLTFSASLVAGVRSAEMIILALPSPLGPDGTTDMTHWVSAAAQLAPLLRPFTVVALAGTVRVGTSSLLRTILGEEGRLAGSDFEVVTLPAQLQRGRAVVDALAPRTIVVGGRHDRAIGVVRQLYAPAIRDGARFAVMSTQSAEVLPYATAAMRTVLRGFAWELGAFCEEGGADSREVLDVLGAGDDLGAAITQAHSGFPSSRDLRDARAMNDQASNWGCVSWTVDAALDDIPRSADDVLSRLREVVGDDLSGVRIAVWGMATAAGTDDVSDSLGARVVRSLLSGGARVAVYSPGAEHEVRLQLGESVEITDAPLGPVAAADALLVLSRVPSTRATDFTRVRRLMSHPIVIDPLSLWPTETMRAAGIRHYAGGRQGANRLSSVSALQSVSGTSPALVR